MTYVIVVQTSIPMGISSTAAQMKDISSTNGHCDVKSKNRHPVAAYTLNKAEVTAKAPKTKPSEPA